MSVISELRNNVTDWREVLTPKFWEYRRAMRILKHAKEEVYRGRMEERVLLGFAAATLTQATWDVERSYYRLNTPWRHRWPYFWEAAK